MKWQPLKRYVLTTFRGPTRAVADRVYVGRANGYDTLPEAVNAAKELLAADAAAPFIRVEATWRPHRRATVAKVVWPNGYVQAAGWPLPKPGR